MPVAAPGLTIFSYRGWGRERQMPVVWWTIPSAVATDNPRHQLRPVLMVQVFGVPSQVGGKSSVGLWGDPQTEWKSTAQVGVGNLGTAFSSPASGGTV